jgi:hypothetical protein
MNVKSCIAVLALALGVSAHGIAQAPAGAPAGSTGQCNDLSYTSASMKIGACRGHKGVKAWYAATSTTSKASAKSAKTSQPAASAAPAASPAPAAAKPSATAAPSSTPAPAPKASSASSAAPAPGGGPGMVWVNTASNVYHCSGTRYYGTTKAGKYMTEADAKAAGARPDHGKGCGL